MDASHITATLHGQTLALILWSTGEDGKDDVAVLHGTLRSDGESLFMVRANGPEFPILREWHNRIKRVSDPEVSSVVRGASYCLSLTVGDLPEDVEHNTLQPTGLKWPT